MKKLIIIFLSLFLSFSVQANENHLKQFDKWLVKYEFNQFVKFVQGQGEGKCKSLVKYSNVWYYNKCDKPKYKNNLKIKFFESWLPADHSKSKDAKKYNFDTLLYEFFKFNVFTFIKEKYTTTEKYEVKPSSKP